MRKYRVIIVLLLVESFFPIFSQKTITINDGIEFISKKDLINEMTSIVNQNIEKYMMTQKKELMENDKQKEYLYTTIISFCGLLFLVLGTLLAINIINNSKVMSDAKKELNEIKELKNGYDMTIEKNQQMFDKKIQIKIADFEKRANIELNKVLKNEYEQIQIENDKSKLDEILSENNPSKNVVFQLLTRIYPYPSYTNNKLYSKALEKFKNDRDIQRIVIRGLKMNNRTT
jgi:hypothetical protein